MAEKPLAERVAVMETEIMGLKDSFTQLRTDMREYHTDAVRVAERQTDRIVRMEIWRAMVTGGLLLAVWFLKG